MGDEWYSTVYENRHSEVNEFIQQKQNLGRSERTLNAYSRILREFFHDEFSDLTPGEVRVQHVEEYVSELTARGLAQNSKRRYLESISSFYSWAMKRPRFDDINGNPAAVVLEEIPTTVRERPDCATWENGKAIVHHVADPRHQTVCVLMAKTGARVSEVLKLEMDDLMLDEGFIRFRNRKGGTTTVFPVDEETRQAMERYLFIRKDCGLDYVFTSIRGNRMSREQIRRSVRAAAVDANVMDEGENRFEKKFTSHTYRTVFTTEMRNAGLPMHVLRYLRGDASREAVDVYTRVDRQLARDEYLQRIKSLQL